LKPDGYLLYDIAFNEEEGAGVWESIAWEREEDVITGLMAGNEETWQFSVLIFICSQIARNTELDLRRLMEDYRRRESSN
jgi:hypothetical protein